MTRHEQEHIRGIVHAFIFQAAQEGVHEGAYRDVTAGEATRYDEYPNTDNVIKGYAYPNFLEQPSSRIHVAHMP